MEAALYEALVLKLRQGDVGDPEARIPKRQAGLLLAIGESAEQTEPIETEEHLPQRHERDEEPDEHENGPEEDHGHQSFRT